MQGPKLFQVGGVNRKVIIYDDSKVPVRLWCLQPMSLAALI